MKTLEAKQQVALKNILFATDLDVSLIRALPFAVALARRYGAKLYVLRMSFRRRCTPLPILNQESES